MSRLAPTLAVLLSLAAAPAFSADATTAARAEVQRLRDELTALRDRQLALRAELNGVGDRIEALKAQGSGRLLRRDALDAELRRSQALSTELTGIATRIAQGEEAVTQAQQGVVQGLTSELDGLRAQLETTRDRDARRELIARMRALRDERERYSAALPKGSQIPSLSSGASDDPEDLLEQADALRDSRDKVQKRLAAIDARVRELRQEQELEKRLNEFVDEESLFDESDRRLGRSSGPRAVFGDQLEQLPNNPGTVSGGAGGADPVRAPQTDRHPAAELGQPPADDLRALEAEQKRLSTLASELEARARDAERKALELR